MVSICAGVAPSLRARCACTRAWVGAGDHPTKKGEGFWSGMWVLLAAVAAVAAAAAAAAFMHIAPVACAHLLISTPSARYNSGKSWLFLICSCDISRDEPTLQFSRCHYSYPAGILFFVGAPRTGKKPQPKSRREKPSVSLSLRENSLVG